MTIQEPSEAPEHPADELTVVGVGASAGGLEALSDLLQHLPPAPKMAFVLIQHLDPHHESALPELLSKQTAMRVVPVHNEMRLQPERVYVIAPNSLLRVRHGWLRLEARPPDHFKPIDSFFHSLAEDFRERAIGVVLSGTATDGTLGLKHIKAEGGLTFAQDESAKFDNMPRSAVAAGAVDFVLPPKRIAEELVAIAQRPDRFKPAGARAPSDGLAFERLLLMLRRHSGVDFTQYKQPTIARRFNRRMVVRKTGSIDEYIQILQKEPGELDALFNDLLINVTDFFRDPDVFEAAKRVAFSSLVQSRKPPHTLRVWIPGCSTGEEVYSMAIALTEFLEAEELGCAIQMFGTDVSERTIEVARKGLYNESSVLNVSPERIRRFFVRSDGGYQVSRVIRDMCIFSRHNVAKDPPLSRMDIVSCRNLLIYFNAPLQNKVIATFSYALQPGGCLILGPSESLGSLADHFSVLDEPRKIYCRRTTPAPQPFEFSDDRPEPLYDRVIQPAEPAYSAPPPPSGHIQRYADQIVLSRFGPSGFTVDESLRVTSYRGVVDHYLVAPGQDVGAELMSIIRPELRAVLSATIEQARRAEAVVVAETAGSQSGNGRPVAITAIPLGLAGNPRHYLILLGRTAESKHDGPDGAVAQPPTAITIDEENANLRQELTSTREYLQSVIEELRSTNEEVQSANEELQSTNEEMQTSKEELQSSNEELHTINAELQSRNGELAQVNDDLINLLGSMHMPIIMTGRDLRIRRFTPIAEKALRLIPSDVGRPIADIKPRINVPDLEDILRRVLETLQPYERDVEDQEGRSYLLRVRPYRTSDDRIDGAVLQLLDVSEIKRGMEKVKHARDYAEAIVSTIHEPLAVLDEQLILRDANPAFFEAIDFPERGAKGKSIFDVAAGRFDTPAIRAVFDQLKQGATELNDVEIEPRLLRNEVRTLLLNARRLRSPGQEPLILLAFEDITERKRAAEARYRRLFESARDGIVIIDAKTGAILDLNPFTEHLLGYRKEELIGRRVWEAEAVRHNRGIRDVIAQIRERGSLRFDHFGVRPKGGREIEVEVIANLYAEGDRQAIQFNMRDVSERRKFERELQETQKLEGLGLLAGGVAHDFNNLLTGILGNASLALADTTPDQPLRVRLRQIVDAAERAGFLTRQMLAYAGRGQFVIAAIDLGDLVREISGLVRPSIPKSVDLKLDLAPDLPPIEADSAQIQQVVMNLVINGAEAVGENTVGTVSVRTSVREVGAREAAELFQSEPAEPGTYLLLEVTDTGSGMDEATKARIFDPFFTTKFTGRGLGLAAVQGIVRQHHGAIFVHSAPGRGATFRVFFPASREKTAGAPKREDRLNSIPAGSVALVVDDEKTVRSVAEQVLSRSGMKVLTAVDGGDAVRIFREHSAELSVVVLDLEMPVMGGEEALRLMREINPDVPVVLSSGYDESEANRRLSSSKPSGFLRKPYTAQRLVNCVAGVFKRREGQP